MNDALRYPKLRWPLDIRTERTQEQEVLLLSCPLGISRTPLALVSAVGPILARFDGSRSIEEILEQLSRYGITSQLLHELVTLLDQHLFLASPSYFAAEAEFRRSYHQRTTREAALAGAAYPAEPLALQLAVKEMLGRGGDPHRPRETPATDLVCLMAPHIDYRRGGDAYGASYRALEHGTHDLYLLLGTAHQFSPHLFHLTKKHFETPLGLLRTDIEFVDQLAQRYGTVRSFADEVLHRREHSLELQLPFLAHLLTQPAIVPILIGGFHHMVQQQRLPNEFSEYEEFAAALSELITERVRAGQSVAIIAGVDMAHVGQNFGDTFPLTPEFMQQVAQRDREYLATLEALDRTRLFQHIAEDQDARRICGFPTMYLVLDLLERLALPIRTRCLDYRQAVDYRTQCAVTFAGMAFYRASAT